MLNVFQSIKASVSGLLRRMRKPGPRPVEDADDADDYGNARMSYNRLQALEGPGYRQCYMEKLREVSDNTNDQDGKERWFSDQPQPLQPPEQVNTVEAELAAKRRKRITQAQNRMSYTRLQALVQNMSPEERILNEVDEKRLGGLNQAKDDKAV